MKKQTDIMPAILIVSLLIIFPQTGFTQELAANTTIKTKTISNMKTSDYTTTILVDQTPKQVFDAINNVRGWWSEEIEGSTEKLHDEFTYHYKDVHRCKMKIIEFVPDKKVVWLCLDNYFSFIKDKSEWIGTKIIFEISKNDGKTQIHFTHQGLVPEYECYSICFDSWDNYIKMSLHNLIATGKGQPNPKDKDREFNEQLLKQHGKQQQDFCVNIRVNATAHEAFKSINSVSKWWTENLEGSSQKLNDEFTVRFGNVHVSTQKLIEIIPDKKVVWLVTESNLNFIEDKHEWTGTKISFEIAEMDGKTQVRFTHLGLVPEMECFKDCSNVWGQYIQQSLLSLINTGKGYPNLKDKEREFNEQLLKQNGKQ